MFSYTQTERVFLCESFDLCNYFFSYLGIIVKSFHRVLSFLFNFRKKFDDIFRRF